MGRPRRGAICEKRPPCRGSPGGERSRRGRCRTMDAAVKACRARRACLADAASAAPGRALEVPLRARAPRLRVKGGGPGRGAARLAGGVPLCPNGGVPTQVRGGLPTTRVVIVDGAHAHCACVLPTLWVGAWRADSGAARVAQSPHSPRRRDAPRPARRGPKLRWPPPIRPSSRCMAHRPSHHGGRPRAERLPGVSGLGKRRFRLNHSLPCPLKSGACPTPLRRTPVSATERWVLPGQPA